MQFPPVFEEPSGNIRIGDIDQQGSPTAFELRLSDRVIPKPSHSHRVKPNQSLHLPALSPEYLLHTLRPLYQERPHFGERDPIDTSPSVLTDFQASHRVGVGPLAQRRCSGRLENE